MGKTVLLFPGQGSQKTQMGDRPEFKSIFNKASEVLGYDLIGIISDSQKLNQTVYTQPSVFVTSCAWLNKLKIKDKADYLIGHSLGEWTAVVAAQCISFEDGLAAVALRAKLMDEIAGGGMAAVLGITSDEIEKDLKSIDDLNIANYNLPSQTVISGSKDAIKDYSDKCNGKVISLKVSGAFHSKAMENAKKTFNEELSDLNFNDAKIPLILNETAIAQTSGSAIKKSLIGQLTKPVYFYQSLDYAISKGVNNFYEIGPSNVLTNMVKKYNDSVNVMDSQSIDRAGISDNNSTNHQKEIVGF